MLETTLGQKCCTKCSAAVAFCTHRKLREDLAVRWLSLTITGRTWVHRTPAGTRRRRPARVFCTVLAAICRDVSVGGISARPPIVYRRTPFIVVRCRDRIAWWLRILPACVNVKAIKGRIFVMTKLTKRLAFYECIDRDFGLCRSLSGLIRNVPSL